MTEKLKEIKREKERLRKMEQRKKTKRIDLMVSKEQYAFLKENADAQGFKHLSVFLRHCALAYLAQVFVLPDPSRQEMKFLRKHLASVTSNINQLTRYTHTEKDLSAPHLSDLIAHVRSLDQVVFEAFEFPPNLWSLFQENLEQFPRPFLEHIYDTLTVHLEK